MFNLFSINALPYPFGSSTNGRSFSSQSYRYGFNSREKDNETYGSNNAYDFGARIYDSRLGKWFSIDPFYKNYVPYTNYGFAINNPIIFVDVDGNVIMDGDKKVIITMDAEKKTITFKLEGGGDVSPEFQKNGAVILSALAKTEYGQSLVSVLDKDELEYSIQIKTVNSGKFGDPKKVEKDGVLKGYELNFQKYDAIELAGTRYDHAGEDEYYGGIAAHDVIDVGTTEGRAVNAKKDADWADENSGFRTAYSKWVNAKQKNKEAAKTDFFQYLIDNYEKIGMDAELKFRNQLPGNTLDTKIGELNQNKQLEGNNPNLKDKTPRDVYTKGVK